jgi:CubicO group peptidase (beta-lactamase class C family)
MKILLATLALSMLPVAAIALPENEAAALTRQLQAIVDDPAIPLTGLSAVAIRGGEIVYSANLGYKRLAPAEPVDANTLFRVASVSKFVTALGAMKLVEQGKLSLDADIGETLGYRLRNPHFPDTPITLRMLLTHTSSLRDEGGFKWPPSVDLRDVLVPGGSQYGEGKSWATNAPPGRYFEYVNFNWGLLATVMERATGERFDRLMRRLIFDPMQLKAGFYLADFAPARVADVATLYRKREKDGAEAWDPRGPWIAQADDFSVAPPAAPEGFERYVAGSNGTLFGPQGSLRISAAELARIMLMLMHEGRDRGRQILAPETIKLLFSHVRGTPGTHHRRPPARTCCLPAKTAEIGREAILHGADAVYIGGPAFGARHNASNPLEDIAAWSVRAPLPRAHLRDDEHDHARRRTRPGAQQIWQLYEAGVDALIVQDMGLLEMDLPPIQLHASTQCDIRTWRRRNSSARSASRSWCWRAS